MDDVSRLLLYFLVVVFSCVFHECAHVWVALKQGDTTGRDLGRLTLNPLPHIDLFWTVLLPIVSLWTTGFPIGGPKPAPVQPANFRNGRVGDLLCSMAGPFSNFLLMAAAFVLLWAGMIFFPDLMGERASRPDPLTGIQGWEVSWNGLFLYTVIFVNLNLGLVNLIPVPPLDGSRFLHFVVGRRLDAFMELVDRTPLLSAGLIFFAFRFIAPGALLPFWTLVLLPTLAFALTPDYAVSLWEAYWAR
jgi:Zn-dependent protease